MDALFLESIPESEWDERHTELMLHCLQADHAAAIRSARRALALDARNAAPYSPLALALRATGDVDGEAAAYGAMIEAAPTSAIGNRKEGMDPLPMLLIARNIWGVPMFETTWLFLRARLRDVD